jgi:ATP-dependent HslUV protease ATP-binding subunit HslU
MNDILNLTPKQIVKELNRYIIGQDDAKKAVAISFRNRWRRKKVDEPLREEIVPKNILMIGPTGVGKTEIARRIAKLSGSPFIKVEATKFTEVGYVGRDVDSIIRDLADVAMITTREKMRKEVTKKAHEKSEERVIDALVGDTASDDTREKFRKKLRNGELDDKEIEIEIQDNSSMGGVPSFDIPGMPGGQMGVLNIGELLGKAIGGGRTKSKTMAVKDAYKILMNEESDKLIDEEKIVKQALDLTENYGIVFIDEMDKICVRSEARGGEVSREGVQRDLLPLIEGTSITTKYGIIKTDHILFIASGAFHMASPADLLPELQGRLPIRVELKALSEKDMMRILKEPESSLIKQYEALMLTEGVELEFTACGIEKLAAIASEVNQNVENIGARRLHTILEKLLEEISFEADSLSGNKIKIDEEYVTKRLKDLMKVSDLSKFIL